jgi:hypothetical protein
MKGLRYKVFRPLRDANASPVRDEYAGGKSGGGPWVVNLLASLTAA